MTNKSIYFSASFNFRAFWRFSQEVLW